MLTDRLDACELGISSLLQHLKHGECRKRGQLDHRILGYPFEIYLTDPTWVNNSSSPFLSAVDIIVNFECLDVCDCVGVMDGYPSLPNGQELYDQEKWLKSGDEVLKTSVLGVDYVTQFKYVCTEAMYHEIKEVLKSNSMFVSEDSDPDCKEPLRLWSWTTNSHTSDITTYVDRALAIISKLGHKTRCIKSLEFTVTTKHNIDFERDLEILNASQERMTSASRDQMIESIRKRVTIAKESGNAEVLTNLLRLVTGYNHKQHPGSFMFDD